MSSRAAVDVFRHRDYRVFLREYYSQRKERKAGYSLRAFSQTAGLRSPNYLKLVMDGERNLTPEMALRFANSCDLSGEAADYFCELVAYNQAQSAAERERHYRQLRRFRRFRRVHKLDVAQEAYHSHWYIPVIRELVARPDFQEDAKWIAKTLLPPISPTNARDAIGVLCDLGLLVRDTGGRLVQAEPLIETPEGPLGHQVVEFHRAMMGLASEALDRVSRDEREISSVTLCLSKAKMNELKKELEELREDLLQRYQADEQSERVVQVNLQMFPLSAARRTEP
ncbi:MAG: TIGR02147 family protein [Polyangiaceae bacterium]|nr:TIGR02147 family protein [Polyangiaceae bacterium]